VAVGTPALVGGQHVVIWIRDPEASAGLFATHLVVKYVAFLLARQVGANTMTKHLTHIKKVLVWRASLGGLRSRPQPCRPCLSGWRCYTGSAATWW
jgi:hypothetical protein